MQKLNISEYKYEANEQSVYYGRVLLKNGFKFADGDEYFYEFVGDKSCYSLIELLHPDDVEEFMKMTQKLKEGTQYALLRMRCFDDSYRYLYAIFSYNGRVFEDFESIEMDFCDFMSLRDRCVQYRELLQKYRQFMSMSSCLYFEYIYNKNELLIYRYKIRRSIPILRVDIDDLWDSIENDDKLSYKVKEDYKLFYDNLKNKTQKYEQQIDVDVNGTQTRYMIKGTLLVTEDGKYMSVGTLKALEEIQKTQSYYLSENALDPGTGLINKRAIYEFAVEKIQEHSATKEGMYLAIMDIDDFKKFNDLYGHLYGDQVLAKVAENVRNVIGSRGLSGRYGGDEFVIVLDNISDEKSLRRVIKTICKHLEWEFSGNDDTSPVTTSWGIAKYPDDGESFEELFTRADKSLYIAKRKGKNRYIIYDEKKHGNVETGTEQKKINVQNIVIGEEQKANAVSELVLRLSQDGVKVLPDTMKQVMQYFDIDGIAIFTGKEMKRTLSEGDYENPIQQLTCMNDNAYIKLFDDRGIYMESTINRLDNTYRAAFELYEKQGNGKFIQFAAFENGKVNAVVEFDFFHRSPKFGISDQNLIVIIGRLMAQIAQKL